MEQVTGANGQTLDCYVINSEVYGTNTRDYYYFYPVNDKDYLVVNVNVWADGEGEEVKADITAIADELVMIRSLIYRNSRRKEFREHR